MHFCDCQLRINKYVVVLFTFLINNKMAIILTCQAVSKVHGLQSLFSSVSTCNTHRLGPGAVAELRNLALKPAIAVSLVDITRQLGAPYSISWIYQFQTRSWGSVLLCQNLILRKPQEADTGLESAIDTFSTSMAVVILSLVHLNPRGRTCKIWIEREISGTNGS